MRESSTVLEGHIRDSGALNPLCLLGESSTAPLSVLVGHTEQHQEDSGAVHPSVLEEQREKESSTVLEGH